MSFRIIELSEPKLEFVESIINLEKETFGESALNEWTLPVIIKYGKVFVFEDAGEFQGEAALIRHWSNPSVAYLITFAIRKEKRGRGLGRIYLTELMNKVKRDSILRLQLTVSPENKSALSLYQGLGFREKAFLKDHYGSGESRILLEKYLGD